MNAEEREAWAEFVEAVASGPGERITEKRTKAILAMDALLAGYEMGVPLAKAERRAEAAEQRAADAEAEVARWNRAYKAVKLWEWDDLLTRAEAAEAALAESEDGKQCIGVYARWLKAVLAERDAELSALWTVEEAVVAGGTVTAVHLRTWAATYERQLGYDGAMLCWLHNVADALAAWDAARGGGEQEQEGGESEAN